jgi:ferric-dicitrate binding protein FerR (iron transport regulator)
MLRTFTWLLRKMFDQAVDADPIHDSRGNDATDSAVAWFIALNDISLSEDKRRAFASWLAQDPTHGEEMDEIARVWFLVGEAIKVKKRSDFVVSRQRALQN